MLIHVSDQFRGRVDVVPNCCYVATEFVCAWMFPLLPRRSALFFKASTNAEHWSTLPVPLSVKSVIIGYLGSLVWTCLGLSCCGFGALIFEGPPNAWRELVPFFGALIGAASLVLLLLRQLSRASYRRRERLAEVKGLPSHVVAALLEERFDAVGHLPEQNTFARSEMIPPAGSAKATPARLEPVKAGDGIVPATVMRRACAWFLDGVVVIVIYIMTLVTLFGVAQQNQHLGRIISRWMDRIALSLPFAIGLAYNVGLSASPLRATAGKWMLGLRITDSEGRRIRLRTAIVRELIKYPCLFFEVKFGHAEVHGATIHDSLGDRWLHDRIAQTQIVRVPHTKRSKTDGA